MRSFKTIAAAAFAVLAFTFVSADAQNFRGVRASNFSPIERSVFKRILSLPDYGVFDHITYQVNGGTVTLYGKVLSLGTKKAAERSVLKVNGVTNVINHIQNLPPSGFDSSIRRNLVREFARNAGLYGYLREPDPSVRLIVENGRVTLEGYVNNNGTSQLIEALASSIPGVFSVTNHLILQRELPR